MRPLPHLLLAAALAVPAFSQTTPSTAQSLPPSLQNKHIVAVKAPPASMRPKKKNRLSTSQRAALSHEKPTPKVLPSFIVLDRDGKKVASATLVKAMPSAENPHWLLVFRTERCLPCDRLMNVLAASSSPDLKSGAPYAVVVSGNSKNGLEKVRATFGNLSAAHWMLDRDRQFRTALKPHGSPVIYAMDGQNIAWKLPGNLGDSARVEKLTSAWIAAPVLTASKASSNAGQ